MTKTKERKLTDIIPLLSEDQLKVVGRMIDDAVFMEEQLRTLREQIRREGSSEQYQYGSKQTAAMVNYLSVQKQYGTIIRFLSSLIPVEKGAAVSNNLLDWVNSH